MRAYIRRRRGLMGYTQESLAEAIGAPYPTYRDFESGATYEIRAGLFARLVDVLNIPLDHIRKLSRGISVDEASDLALEWLKQEQALQVQQFQGKLRRVIELGEQDPERMERVIERLRSDARADPEVLDLVMAYLDGRRSSRE